MTLRGIGTVCPLVVTTMPEKVHLIAKKYPYVRCSPDFPPAHPARVRGTALASWYGGRPLGRPCQRRQSCASGMSL